MCTRLIFMLLCLVSRSYTLFRLPTGVVPIHYDVLVAPRQAEQTFEGEVVVNFAVTQVQPSLFIHARDLNITFTELKKIGGKYLFTNETVPMEDDETIRLDFGQDLQLGKYNLHLKFVGRLSSGLDGFYLSKYRAPGSNNNRYLSTTKFEPTSARAAFPCFDEPHLKATFSIKVVYPKNGTYNAISNEEIESRTIDGDDEIVEFKKTPRMSTYLVAFIVSDFTHLPPVMVNNPGGSPFPLKVYSAPHLVNSTSFALNIGKSVFEYFIDYFKMPYQLSKMDLIAIPDFMSGAMENWGLITFRENKLLISDEDGANDLRNVAKVVAHEIAHQWFGNLVTMKWWNDIWLNEGFARFMEMKGMLDGTGEYGKGWKQGDYGIFEVVIASLKRDGDIASSPIVSRISEASEIPALFNPISYGKGASILYMMETAMGAENFRQGIQEYLNRFQYSNANSDELFETLNEFTDVNVTSILSTWTLQETYPLISVVREGNRFYVSQSRYIDNINTTWSDKTSVYGYKWDVPICFTSSNNSDETHFLLLRSESRAVLISPGAEWIKVNCKFNGFYRVKYDKQMYDIFIQELNRVGHGGLHSVDRANLLDDAFSLASSGHIPYDIPLEMTSYLEHNENKRLPLVTGIQHLWSVRSKLKKNFMINAFLTDIVNRAYDTFFRQNIDSPFKWNLTEKQIQNDVQLFVLTMTCKVGGESCIQPVGDYFKLWISKDIHIAPNVRSLVYVTGMKTNGTVEDWSVVLERYKKEHHPIERDFLLTALCSIDNDEVKGGFLKTALHGDVIRSQDFFHVLSRMAAVSSKLVWRFYKENYPAIVERFSLRNKGLGTSLLSIVSKFNSKKQLEEVLNFFGKYPDAGVAKRSRALALQKIRGNILWKSRSSAAIEIYLSSKAKKFETKLSS